ncbi:MAG: DUF3160 domain-containing protein, partial [Candidatus Eremiobacteraeota bacterium]|nr:DUF3160 domain-containing protein [Candidatus Eremiobacteraeota bacterium]
MDRRILVIVLCLAMARAYAQPPDYGARFKTEIEAIGQPAPDDFAAQYPPSGLEAIDYDPTSAAFFKELNLEPPEAAEGETPRPDLRLSQQELATFRRIGFVVSERLGRDSFTGLLYRVYSADLPLFVSGDAVLHAWHQSFNETFAQLELVVLAPRLEAVLTRMQGAVPEVWSAYGKGALGQSVQDADYLLAVALSLFHGKPVAPQLDQTERVRATLEQCKSEKTCNFPLFGYDRRVDFAALKVRGRYERYPKLRGYFQAMVWLKLAGLRLTEDPNADRELATALVLAELLDRSGQTHAWKRFEHILTHLVGPTDGLSLLQAHSLVHEGAALNVAAARTKLLEGSLGIEQIPSYLPNIDLTASAPRRPRMFFFTGARFTLGSWALSQTVFERVVWDQHKVMRRIPSSLDVAFGVLANDATVPELVRRLKEVEVPFRDGLNYHHSLMAVRRTIDAITEQDWNGCMPMQWLSVLRALSGPADPRAPQSMRTRAWALRSVTTQLGSWSELRHDI